MKIALVAALLVAAAAKAGAAEPSSPAQPASTARPPNEATSGFVTVKGVRLHYLDWGGRGEPILFLTGFRDNAHVFDDFAPRFTDRFHVLGLTRRGFGESDKPPGGYDTNTRVEDIRHFLDDRQIARATLIGHSMAGEEMTAFAARYPDRVAKLVYLDAAFDRTPEGFLAGLDDPANKPGMVQRMRMEALGMPEASGIVVENMPPPEQWAILVAIHKALFAARPDYKHVKAPALAFYAVTANDHYPSHWLPKQATDGVRRQADAWWQKKGHALMRQSVEQFQNEMPRGEIIELHDTNHYIFTGETADEVAQKTREFLLR